MSFRLMQFPPQSIGRVIRMKAIREPWSGPSVYSHGGGFLQSWIEDEDSDTTKRTNWGAISGLALSVVISAGFWTGLALLIQRVWR
ncbi:MAG: hypothetical protein ABSG34_01395 [Candidatus Sulfotelmatobacter sp.]